MKTALLMASMTMALSAPALAADFNVAPSSGHQPIKAQVTNPAPENFEINLKKAANLGADQKAPTFAMYTTGSVPDRCGDFRNETISYKKPDKYHRVFNLSDKPEVLAALDEYGCVIIKNKPSLPPSGS